jgi:dTDP-4-amino-4,6-dideoxygalactose transaminase
MALRVLNIGPGDEVIVPDYTYPTTASVVAIVGATAVIVDVSKDTMLIDCDAVERAITPRTKAVIPVSIFGNPLDYDSLNTIKQKHGITIVEDAACSIGVEYKGITDWAAWMESYKHFGMGAADSREGTVFARIGTNYKLSNILAAVGLGQMEKIDELLARRRSLANTYIELLKDCKQVTIPAVTPEAYTPSSLSVFLWITGTRFCNKCGQPVSKFRSALMRFTCIRPSKIASFTNPWMEAQLP